MRDGDGLASALKAVAKNCVFTTHTPVPAGNEAFDRGLVRRYLDFWTREVGCDPEEALALRVLLRDAVTALPEESRVRLQTLNEKAIAAAYALR